VTPIGWTVLALFFPELAGIVAAMLLMRRVQAPLHGIDDDDESGAPRLDPDEPEAEFTEFIYVITFPRYAAEEGGAAAAGRAAAAALMGRQRDPAADAKQTKAMHAVVQRIHDAKLHCKLYLSRDKQEIVCKIRASRVRLEFEADRLNVPLRLDPNVLRSYDRAVKAAAAVPPPPPPLLPPAGAHAWRRRARGSSATCLRCSYVCAAARAAGTNAPGERAAGTIY
jgi:hypothetical protein